MTVSMLDAASTFAGQGDWARVVPAARQALASNPDDAYAHALLALGLAHLEEAAEAVSAARRAVALAPELSFAHYALGWALIAYGDTGAAERAAREALRLEPGPDEHALMAHVYSRQRRWQAALDMAERGLEDDPEHGSCSNFRALALTNLGRSVEANDAVHRALAFDPDSAYSHANRGWLLLRESRIDEALDSFRSALRLDPSMDWARTGIIEAMKARNGLYRLLLRFALWTSSLSDRGQWFLIVGLYFVFSFGRSVLRHNPELWPILGPAMGAYVLFVFGSWIGDPLSSLFLRLNPTGRLALNRFENAASNVVGGLLATATAAGVVFMLTAMIPPLVLAVVCILLLIPIGGAIKGQGTRAWRPLSMAALVMAAGGAATVAASWLQFAAGGVLIGAFVLATFLWSWVANYFLTRYR